MEDGTVIYPFDFAEELYEKDGKLYLIVNQGITKSYQNQAGISPKALFVSEDRGESWSFVEEIGVTGCRVYVDDVGLEAKRLQQQKQAELFPACFTFYRFS